MSIILRIKPGKVKIGASLTSQLITLSLPPAKILEKLNQLTKGEKYKKILVEITQSGDSQEPLNYKILYPGDPQVLRVLLNESSLSLIQDKKEQDLALAKIFKDLNLTRNNWGLKDTDLNSLMGIKKSCK